MIDRKRLEKAVRGKRVLIDSNIIIYLTEQTEPYYHLSHALFSMIEDGISNAVISILSVSEVMRGPVKAGKIETATAICGYLRNFPNSLCQDITVDVLAYVGSDKSVNWQSLRTVDSLIIASGLCAHAELFISNDRHFMKSLPQKMLLSFDPL